MAFEVEVIKAEKLVRLTCVGDITLSDFIEYLRDFWIGPHNKGFHHLVDLRESNIKFDFGDILSLAAQARPANDLRYSNARTSLVVSSEDQYDRCEFFKHARHQVCNPFIREVEVFYDIDAAEHWLREAVPAIVSQTN